ncbi:Uncharacterized conserved protein YafD, endonuclease/exonuclease/phosphatase (EEP) superfamily [Cognatiyoonia koreensis]|uniref:Uncharacterized conserved protein YafD, endonuclease/exonuclease/phosphatase (EEP) superfamily n=1 Tax=Cognatiyoonia koreensis TaxID=364200 RepID=A0A1I0RE20_9RHOB|nr:endonuclease/exonuclease/phosphatase family protein [Cognatiyoonia koreensis]SEW38999.1 Uncharacterized conserved protein YafD, endonuclease/exonuclease/phosphatase (EEP) superfamily [Cognatiyoonia koreensis]
MRVIMAGFFCLAALGVFLGFGGWLHPAGDSLSLLRPVFGVLCLIGLFLLRPAWLRRAMGIAVLSVAATVVPAFVGQKDGGDLRLYAKNLWWANSQIELVAADILAADVDVVMLQEVSKRTAHVLDLLADQFPYQHWCRHNEWMGEAVVSRIPMSGEGICTSTRGAAAAPIDIDGATVWVASVHIPWPWPYKSMTNEAEVGAVLKGLEGPVVVAGDFNMFPWTKRVRDVAAASGTELVGPTRATLTLWEMPLPIDHVLAPGGGSVERRPLLGSDHRGLIADVRIWVGH